MPVDAIAAGDTLTSELSGLAQRLRAATVQVRSGRDGTGSGVIWSSAGLIVTNAHVARRDRAIVELRDGRTFSANVIASDRRRDLAALSVAAGDLPAATVADSSAVRPGEIVLAVGNPLGLAGALTFGIVHARPAAHAQVPGRWLAADIALAPGNSGGPLADASGRVIGINSMIAGGLALAVPSNAVARFLDRGEHRALLGVAVAPVLVAGSGGRVLGLLVTEVLERSAAADAGLLPGDVILAIEGRRVRHPADLSAALEDADHGQTIALELDRGGRSIARHAAVRAAPGPDHAAA